jgi:serine/threonine protein kinase
MDVFKKNIGEVFDGKYRINRTIGVGGMAIVYEATELATGKRVALKMLKDSISDNTQALRRFINESKAVAMLNHPNIVKILDVSVKTEHKFIVMEYIKGITLRDYMNKKEKLGWQEATAFIAQILQALDHAHMKGVIHRDIKPQNIMVMEGGFIKVADFGIAKIPNAETVTMVDHAVGTIYYISPEQARGKKIDARSDLYSLGVMFYEMITGELPFTAENSYGIMHKHINDAPVPPTQKTPQLPLGVEQIILCAMEKAPERRYQSASQMLRHIYRIQQNPTTIFQRQTPPPRTHTAEVAITRTTEPADKYEPSKARPQQPTQRPAVNKPQQTVRPQNPQRDPRMAQPRPNTAQKQRHTPEYVPFSVVVVICVAFLLLAAIGFFVIYSILCNHEVPQASLFFRAFEGVKTFLKGGMGMRFL